MAKSRVINTKFWADDYISHLDPTEKLLFLYFLTNPFTDISGVYEIPLKNIALDTGIDKEMVEKIIKRFEKHGKIFYRKGWLAIKNFSKHQNLNNPKILAGVEMGLSKAPDFIKDKLSITNQDLSHSNSNLNSNSNLKIASQSSAFVLSEEIKKLEENKRRDLNIIALYFEERKPDIQNSDQFSVALKRHLRDAGSLKPFSDSQILEGVKKAKKQTAEWTLGTVAKMLTK